MTSDSPDASELRPDPDALTIRSFRDGDTHVVELAGELDLLTATEVERELRRAERSDAHVIAVDLRELTFIESTGVRLILKAQRMSRGSNRLVVVKGSGVVQRLFELCGVAHRLPFVDRLPSEDGANSRHATRPATSRRVSQAALAAAVRELRTRRRPGIVG